MDIERNYLFVLDGSKALRSAVRRNFGKRALVQRCQVHKRTKFRKIKGYREMQFFAEAIDMEVAREELTQKG
ncbi:MAG: hypothetical protein ACK415_07945 [Thermodesulfovibrionales bacterium]